MKRTFLLFAVAAVAMLYACSKDAAAVDEAQHATPETAKTEIPTPLTFAQTRQIVADVLGDAVAAKIAPTARYLRITFGNTEAMLTELEKGEIEYSPAPMFGEQAEEVTTNQDQPKPMYALVDSNVALPEGVKCDVLAESFDPHSPLSGLSDEQADMVVRALMPELNATRATTYDWKPSGHILLYDELSGKYMDMPNVPVIVTGYKAGSGTVLQTETVTTNSEGRFACTKEFFGPVSEQAKWANARWGVTTDGNTIAYTNSSALDRTAWNLTISAGGRAHQFATAYYTANYMNTHGFTVSDGMAGGYVYINCLDRTLPSNDEDRYYNPYQDPYKINIDVYCQQRTSLDIINALNRELGKGVHYMKTRYTGLYSQFYDLEKESWGEFTKYYFAETKYTALGALTKLHTYTSKYSDVYGSAAVPIPDQLNRQTWAYTEGLDINSKYTNRSPLYIDIYDSFMQSTWPELRHMDIIHYPVDRLSITDFAKIRDYALKNPRVANLRVSMMGDAESYDELTYIDKLMEVYKLLEQAQHDTNN